MRSICRRKNRRRLGAYRAARSKPVRPCRSPHALLNFVQQLGMAQQLIGEVLAVLEDVERAARQFGIASRDASSQLGMLARTFSRK